MRCLFALPCEVSEVSGSLSGIKSVKVDALGVPLLTDELQPHCIPVSGCWSASQVQERTHARRMTCLGVQKRSFSESVSDSSLVVIMVMFISM